jgi:hypothetical protein
MHQFLSESGRWAKAQALTAAPQSASVGRVQRLEHEMTRTITVSVLATGAAAIMGLAATSPGLAQSTSKMPDRSGGATEFSAQSRPDSARARTRIRVTPVNPDTSPYRPYSTTYPVPYKYDYPGRGYVRQCSSWLATEHRVAGTVLTPQMRCWWQPGS